MAHKSVYPTKNQREPNTLILPAVFANTYFVQSSLKKFYNTQVLIHSLPLETEEQTAMEDSISPTKIQRYSSKLKSLLGWNNYDAVENINASSIKIPKNLLLFTFSHL